MNKFSGKASSSNSFSSFLTLSTKPSVTFNSANQTLSYGLTFSTEFQLNERGKQLKVQYVKDI